MKLTEVVEQQAHNGERLTDAEFEIAYDKLIHNPMSKEEINDFVTDMVESGKYQRSVRSLYFLINRMHIILHGEASQGVSPSEAIVMFKDSKPTIDYVLKRGDFDEEDVKSHIGHAVEEFATRPAPPPRPKMKREEAAKLMGEYFMANKDAMPPAIRDKREEIIKDIMFGLSAEEAFARHM